ncbi:hypothetical protein J4G43_047370 [Bradyrhizobium barranii subsp. barranii]|uniref:Uncharacterized protein n=1 Tax=Bradyrhizobium barranii subsp. barranii TaxID=2823807 RepID=A0A939MIQ8_9BRAD|nr:hypothetical protein [Bradyrhizobium barranii]UEM11989.1 hypothetical protein J4G43_047370 [Bradyrhizobium barranii subsp. barranii]
MAYSNELTEIALNELKLHGVKGQTRDTNGGHIEIAWQVVPEKEVRRVFVAKTASDWRARMNTRAEVRKLLRADNVTLKAQNEKPEKPKPLTKALELPQPDAVVPIPDQMKALRGELADLTELVLRLTKIATGMREVLTTHVPKPQPAAPAVKPSSRSIKLVEYLSLDRWITISALVRDTGLTPTQIKLKLHYLKQHDQIEIYRGEVRLKPAVPKPSAKKAAKKVAKAKQPARKKRAQRIGLHEVAPAA